MNCKNCNNIVDGNFCTHCGQSAKVDKINFSNFLSELSDSIFQIDKGFFYSLKELFVRPGHSIREYLSGKRKNHFKPIAYVLILSTVYFLLSQFLEVKTVVGDFVEGYSNVTSDSGMTSNEINIFNWLIDNYAYTILLLLPLYSLASYLAFLKSEFNYLEHFVLNCYITGQQAIVYSLSALFSLITKQEDILVSITILISISYAFFVFRQFFYKQSRVSVMLRFILTYVVFLILFGLVSFILLAFTLSLR